MRYNHHNPPFHGMDPKTPLFDKAEDCPRVEELTVPPNLTPGEIGTLKLLLWEMGTLREAIES